MRKLFVLSFSSIIIFISSAVQADEVSIDVDAALLSMHQEINYLVNENNLLKNQIELLQEAQKVSNQQIEELFKILEVDATNKVIEKVIVTQKENEDKASTLYVDGRKQLILGAHDAAITLFKKCDKFEENYIGRPTTPCKVYILRCEKFKLNPPGNDWDGSWSLSEK